VLLGGAAGQQPSAGRFRGKLTEKASPFPSVVADGPTVTLRENWGHSTFVSTLLGSFDRSTMI